MGSPDRRHWIAFNGEIYDHGRTRRTLEQGGQRFRSGTDTETLLAAWVRWGPECLDRFDGMWAFAIWDDERRRLVLARDRFGIKPLYWAEVAGGIAFASEIRPLLALRAGRAHADAEGMYRYLRFGITDAGDRTMFSGIHRVPPAHWISIGAADSRRQVERYWAPPVAPRTPARDTGASERLRSGFLSSVDQHLLADVPVGVALSGGIDSSAVLAGVRKARGTSSPIEAFGHVTDDPVLGEEKWIDLAATASGANVHKVEPSADDLRRDLLSLVRLQEEPFGSTSIYAQFRVHRLARAHGVPVVLSGQGADELLAGYRAYLGPRFATLLSGGRWLRAARFHRAAGRLPQADRRGLWLRAGASLVPRALEPLARRISGESLLPPWLDADWFRRRDVSFRPAPPARDPRGHLGTRLRQAFLETSLPMLLRYEDRNSMAHSVESRVPFLQRQFVETLMCTPEHLLIDDQAETKAVFRAAMRGVVPDAILDRRDKVGFATPEATWLASLGPVLDAWLLGEAAGRVGGLRPRGLHAEWQAVRTGKKPFDFRIWRGINAIAWASAFDVAFD